MPTRLPTTKSVVHNKNVTIAGLLGYTLGFASLFALLSSFTFLPVLTMIGTLSGQLLCSVWLQSKSVRWIVSVTTGGLFAIVAGLYGSNNPDAVRPIWVWGVAVIGLFDLWIDRNFHIRIVILGSGPVSSCVGAESTRQENNGNQR